MYMDDFFCGFQVVDKVFTPQIPDFLNKWTIFLKQWSGYKHFDLISKMNTNTLRESFVDCTDFIL
jgi:hypothetical protein